MRKIIIFTAVLMLLLSANTAAEEVDFLLDWVPNTNHTGLFVAEEMGWFEQENIKVNFIEPGSNMSVEQVVGAGKADLGISFQEWVTPARIEGVPIISIAAIIQHNTSGFAVLSEKNVETPADLSGLRYGGWGMPIEKAIIKSLVEGSGGEFSEVKFINIGSGDLLAMLNSNKFDFTWIFYAVDGIQAEMRDIDIDIFMLEDYQELVPDYYTPVIITSEKMAAEKPQLLEKFMKAVSRGYIFAAENPDKAAEILYKKIPESSREFIVKSQNWLSPRYIDDAPYWGYQKLEIWKEFADWMLENDLIDEEFSAEKAFTNQFLPDSK
ncbi:MULTISPECIES: ABC transporter substrate-binding protein [unclassified Halanaerobium]|uniref:ABC transporter substrate-binding protein n=1 Tax=unclassified Halanaerobium TaxID=2641197 RepID=UPI000DF11DF8|nr:MULTISPECIES: ABC transporter substrate-binding protein [unclassified Halanaerobium]RCW49239.1 ABC-type nitrate/sulfonate/bicarbonate transport system substrate-binding protein [Halanaerobium sp. MA284_MarDTE_T2]RCW83978.1 ABC-type nitrate/sulfonate/bicarbonate transport system substrate-binding protein [Halanaerobium sp. DL-01]